MAEGDAAQPDYAQTQAAVRLCQVRELDPAKPGASSASPAGSLAGAFSWGSLAAAVAPGAGDLPQLSARYDLACAEIAGEERDFKVRARMRYWVSEDPGGPLLELRIFTVPLDPRIPRDLRQLVELMADLQTGRLGYEPCDEGSRLQCEQLGEPLGGSDGPARHFHQFLLLPKPADSSGLDPDVVRRLVCRADSAVAAEYSQIAYPAALNRDQGAGLAVGPSVTVMWGQPDRIESAAILSALRIVPACSRVESVYSSAHRHVRDLMGEMGEAQGRDGELDMRRAHGAALVNVNEHLSDLNCRLWVGVEQMETIYHLIPDRDVEVYNGELFAAMGLPDRVAVTSRLLERLGLAADAAAAASRSYEQEVAASRQRRWSVVAGLLTVALAPAGLLLAFFGINSTEVDSGSSIFDVSRYWPAYAATIAFLLLALLVFWGMRFRDQRKLAVAVADRR